MIIKSSYYSEFKFIIKTRVTQILCWLTNAEAVFIRDSCDESKFRFVKVARIDLSHQCYWLKIRYIKINIERGPIFTTTNLWLDPDSSLAVAINGAQFSNNWC